MKTCRNTDPENLNKVFLLNSELLKPKLINCVGLVKATDNEHVFGEAAVRLLDRCWAEGTPVRLVGVAVSAFGEGQGRQLELFSPDAGEKDEATAPGRHRDLRALSVAADEVRSRFGKGSLSLGSELRLRESASDTAPMNKDAD